MGYYITVLIVILLSFLIERNQNHGLDNKKQYSLKISIILIGVLTGFRGIEIGLDTRAYSTLYTWVDNATWDQFDRLWIEPGYFFLTKVCSTLLKLNYHQFLILVSALLYGSLYRFIKRYSRDTLISLLVFFAFNCFAFSMSGIRNSLALAICIDIIPLLEKRSVKNAIIYELFVLAAFFFHKSAIICAIVPLLVWPKKRNINILVDGVIFVFAFVFRNQIMLYINDNIKTINIGFSIDLGLSVFVKLILVGIAIFIDFQERDEDDNLVNIRYIARQESIIALGLYLFIGNGANILSRMILYIEILSIIYIPNAIVDGRIQNSNKSKVLIKLFYSIALLVVFLYSLRIDAYNLVPYRFFESNY